MGRKFSFFDRLFNFNDLTQKKFWLYGASWVTSHLIIFTELHVNKFFLLIALFLSTQAMAQVEWKSIFISGDHSIPNFDNGRKTLSQMFASLGASEENQFHLTSTPSEVNESTTLATAQNIVNAFSALNINTETQGCLLFMTSHGIKGQGFYLSQAGVLTPKNLEALVDAACGKAPTVLLISACYSGQFITKNLATDNRIIMTAAIHDRPSFGCSTDTVYTFWDECMIDNIDASETWKELYSNVKVCISEKESQLGARPSLPQAFFGKNVENSRILNK